MVDKKKRPNPKCVVYCKVTPWEEGIDFLNHQVLKLLEDDSMVVSAYNDKEPISQERKVAIISQLKDHKIVGVCKNMPSYAENEGHSFNVHHCPDEDYDADNLGYICIKHPDSTAEWNFELYDVDYVSCAVSMSFNDWAGSSFIYEDDDADHEAAIIRLFVYFDANDNEIHDERFQRFMKLSDL